jgi:hypothetical protein
MSETPWRRYKKKEGAENVGEGERVGGGGGGGGGGRRREEEGGGGGEVEEEEEGIDSHRC